MKRKVVGVVENDPGFLQALTRLLTAHGFLVKPYVSAEAFLASATGKEVTCLVLDIHLDGISGIQLRRHLAAAGRATPVIFMTASDNSKTHQEAADAGCVACLLKPFPAASLINAIAQAAA